MLYRLAACLLAALVLSGPLRADQSDSRLQGLFAALREPMDLGTARSIEEKIWGIWIEHDDQAVARLMDKGMAALSRGDRHGALKSFDRIVDMAPGFAEGWNKRATVYYLLGRHGDSLDDIEKTLGLEPRHFGALAGRGLVYAALDEWELALQAFEDALAVNPHLVGARRNAETLRKELEDREI